MLAVASRPSQSDTRLWEGAQRPFHGPQPERAGPGPEWDVLPASHPVSLLQEGQAGRGHGGGQRMFGKDCRVRRSPGERSCGFLLTGETISSSRLTQ